MKNILSLIVLMNLAFTVYAQENIHRVYCELIGLGKFMSSKVVVTVDFGQDDHGWDARIVDEKGKSISFNSMVDAMNYMGKLGWEFEQAYVVTESKQNVYHWLLGKDISDNEVINEGLKTRKDVEKDKKDKKNSISRRNKSGDDVYF